MIINNYSIISNNKNTHLELNLNGNIYEVYIFVLRKQHCSFDYSIQATGRVPTSLQFNQKTR